MSALPAARLFSFPPVAHADARVLILGSMPGGASLAAGQYYAHPQNQFWPIMERICGAGRSLPYGARLRRLQTQGIALWDVLQSCARHGSLDAAIDHATAVPNDLLHFLREHPRLEHLCCNGSTAFRAVQRFFGTPLQAEFPHVLCLRLPSTSPAHAGMRLEHKLLAWEAALRRG
jgi:TDG/mug DNA glycosylase family protein